MIIRKIITKNYFDECRYFINNGKKDLFFLNVSPMGLAQESDKTIVIGYGADFSFILDEVKYPHISDLMLGLYEPETSFEEKEKLVKQIGEKILSEPELEKLFFSDSILDENGRFLENKYIDPNIVREKIRESPQDYIEINIPYSENFNSHIFHPINSMWKDRQVWGWDSSGYKKISKQEFEKHLVNDGLKSAYAEVGLQKEAVYYHASNDDGQWKDESCFMENNNELLFFFVKKLSKSS